MKYLLLMANYSTYCYHFWNLASRATEVYGRILRVCTEGLLATKVGYV